MFLSFFVVLCLQPTVCNSNNIRTPVYHNVRASSVIMSCYQGKQQWILPRRFL